MSIADEPEGIILKGAREPETVLVSVFLAVGMRHPNPVAAGTLREIHRRIRTGDQRFGIIAGYEAGNTDTRCRIDWSDWCGELRIRERHA